MRWWWVALVVLVSMGALDRLMLAAERRGWIYWRRRKAAPGTAGSGLLSLGALLEPAKEHVLQEQDRQAADIDVAADDETVRRARGDLRP